MHNGRLVLCAGFRMLRRCGGRCPGRMPNGFSSRRFGFDSRFDWYRRRRKQTCRGVRLPHPYTGLAQRKSSLFAGVREETAHGNAARREVRILTTDLSRLKTLKNRCAPAILHANPLCRIAAPNLPAGPGIPPGSRLSHLIFCGEWARARCRSAEPPTAGKAWRAPVIQLIFIMK